jgi:hypothetical protein
MSECPDRNLVTLCTTTSAPSSSGRWRRGVAKVLSTTAGTPARWAPSHSPFRSAIVISGFVGDSIHSSDAPSQHLKVASVSAMSTSRHPRRPLATASSRKLRVPLYASRGATTSPPWRTASNTALIAAMPDEKQSAVPPSRSPMTSSSARQTELSSRP